MVDSLKNTSARGTIVGLHHLIVHVHLRVHAGGRSISVIVAQFDIGPAAELSHIS